MLLIWTPPDQDMKDEEVTHQLNCSDCCCSLVMIAINGVMRMILSIRKIEELSKSVAQSLQLEMQLELSDTRGECDSYPECLYLPSLNSSRRRSRA